MNKLKNQINLKNILLLIFAIIIIGLVWYLAKYYSPGAEYSLSGKIIDATSRDPIQNMTVEYKGTTTQTDQKGEFKLNKVGGEDFITLSGQGLLRPMDVQVNHRNRIDLAISRDLVQILPHIEQYEGQRQYKKVYDYFHPDVKAVYPLDKYLKDKNAWRDQLTDQDYEVLQPEFLGETKEVGTWKSPLTGQKYQNVIEDVILYKYTDAKTKEVKVERKPAYFVQEGNNWYWLYEP